MQPDIESTKPGCATSQTLLDRCLVDGDAAARSSGRRLRRKALGISFAIETAVLALLIIAPLVTSIAQPNFSKPTYVPFLFGATHTHDAGERRPAPSNFLGNHSDSLIHFTVGRVPQRPAQTTEDAEDNANSRDGWVTGQVGSDMLRLGDMRPMAPPLPNEIRKSEEKRLVKISEGVEQAQLISRIEPRYPPLAVQVKKEGTVILHAIISRDGNITSLDVISGPPLLVKAALDAVRQWRYRPTLLNGEPVEVETTITVIFQLRQ
jgi:protein TonB